MSTYCYSHGLVDDACRVCLGKVADMLTGVYPFRSDLEPILCWSQYFPQLGKGADKKIAAARRRWYEKTEEERRWERAGAAAKREVARDG